MQHSVYDVIRDNVISTELKSVGYAEGEQLLEVEFHGGGVYQYFGVSSELHRGLLAAESKGRFFNQWIRERHFFQRIR
jgi:KTSC domain